MPQVASDPVIRSVRPEPLGRSAAADESSGAFGEILDASSAAPDTGGNKLAPANTKESPASAASDDQPAQSVQTATASVPSVITIDLALLAPALTLEGSAATPAAKQQVEGEPAVSGDATAEDTEAETGTDAASATADPKAAEVSLVVAPAPAPASAPVSMQPDVDAAAISLGGRNASSIAAIPQSAPAEAPAQVAVDLPPPSADVDGVSPPDAAKPGDARAGTISADGTAPPDEPAQAVAAALPGPRAAATAGNGEADGETAKSAEAAVALAEQMEAKPSARPAEAGNVKAGERTAKSSKAGALPPKDAPHAGKPAQGQPSPDTSHPAEPAADLDTKPAAHQPHGQSSDHASIAARAAVAAAPSDLLTPTSVAQTVTAQLASNPPALGLNAAGLVASPLQSFWQSTSQRAESSDNAVPISGLAVEIVSRVHEGLRRFEIRLDPPELGRIDVRLDVDRGGNVTSRLTVERVETLDLLRRDAPQLERALQHAGFNTEGGLQFSLRDQNFANREEARQNAATLILPDDEPAATDAARRGYGRLIGLGGGVDIRV